MTETANPLPTPECCAGKSPWVTVIMSAALLVLCVFALVKNAQHPAAMVLSGPILLTGMLAFGGAFVLFKEREPLIQRE